MPNFEKNSKKNIDTKINVEKNVKILKEMSNDQNFNYTLLNNNKNQNIKIAKFDTGNNIIHNPGNISKKIEYLVQNQIQSNKNNISKKLQEDQKEEENKKIKQIQVTPIVIKNPINVNVTNNNIIATIIPKKYIAQNLWSIEDFEIGKKLGSGRFGKVYLVRERKTHFICALKIIFKSQIVSNNIQHQIRREIEIQSHLDHENILKFYGFFWDQRRIFLMLDYAPGGEVYGEMKKSVIINLIFNFIP